jgi:lipid-A-disaccharide synthase
VANLKYFIAAARRIQAQVPSARFAVASFKPHQAELARQAIADSDLPIEVFVRRTPELIHLAHCCLAVSGSVSLELLYHTKPTAILYWISPLAFAVQKRFRRVKYITLVNLLAAKEVFSKTKLPIADVDNRDTDVLFPEYLTCEDKSAQLAEHAVEWLTNDKARQELIARLARLRAEVAHGGASSRAADYMIAQLARLAPPAPRPHFIPALATAHEPWVQSTAA